MADRITNDTCHTWTHHTIAGVCVECVAHGVVFTGTKEQATEQRTQHEQENRQ